MHIRLVAVSKNEGNLHSPSGVVILLIYWVCQLRIEHCGVGWLTRSLESHDMRYFLVRSHAKSFKSFVEIFLFLFRDCLLRSLVWPKPSTFSICNTWSGVKCVDWFGWRILSIPCLPNKYMNRFVSKIIPQNEFAIIFGTNIIWVWIILNIYRFTFTLKLFYISTEA